MPLAPRPPPSTPLRSLLRLTTSPHTLHGRRTLTTGPTTTTSSSGRAPASPPPPPPPPPARWLSTTKARIGACIFEGLATPGQAQEAGALCAELARDWRELIAGSEGFLTAEDRRGLWRREVDWGEMDSMGTYVRMDPPEPNRKSRVAPWGVPGFRHVNNVVYNVYAESGRINWLTKLGALLPDPAQRQQWRDLYTPRGLGLIMQSITTDFKFPVKYPDRITVLHKLVGPSPDAAEQHPADTITLAVLQLSDAHQRPAARCTETLALYDYRAGRKTPAPRFVRDVLREVWREQEEARRVWTARVRRIEERVRELERGVGIQGGDGR